jgi:hypothetical protein
MQEYIVPAKSAAALWRKATVIERCYANYVIPEKLLFLQLNAIFNLKIYYPLCELSKSRASRTKTTLVVL